MLADFQTGDAPEAGNHRTLNVPYDRFPRGGDHMPVPDTAADCGLPLPLSVSVMAAPRDPVAVGLKLTVTVQVPFTGRVLTQLFVCAKSPGFVPVIETAVIVSCPRPLLVTVRVCAVLVVPTV